MHSNTSDIGDRVVATSIVIAMLTFRRPDDLRVALPSLIEQASSVTGRFERVEVLVVDNDADQSAREFVMAFPPMESVIVTYRCEPESGITAARNRALAEAATSDLLVFIDDDERPTEHWLVDLVATFDRGDAVAVVGPVVSRFEVDPSPWIVAGEFFSRRRMATGSQVSVAATNNLLLDLRVVRSIDLRFDTAFGHAGGEDTMFTRALHASGGRLVWCDEAIVWDIVPAARSTRDWVVRRAFSSGNSWSQTSIALETSRGGRLVARLRCLGQGIVRTGGGAIRALIGLVTGSLRHRAKGIRTLARGFGMIAGALGYSYEEYRRADS